MSRSPSPSADLQSALGEAITAAGGGTVTPEAKTAFQRALEIDPQDPRARYYQGLWLQQAGQVREALDSWLELAASTPRDAGWRPLLRQQIVGAAEQLGLPIAELRIPEGTAPESDLPAAAAGVEDMSPEERQAFVRSMVEGLASRLEENPEDLDGWLRLVQARLVLGETEEALAALCRAEPWYRTCRQTIAPRGRGRRFAPLGRRFRIPLFPLHPVRPDLPSPSLSHSHLI